MTKSQNWLARDSTPSLLLLTATALSFALMNSPWGEAFHHVLNEPAAFGATAHLAINDGLMAVFFLYVGLELKREFIEGPLRDVRTAALPIAAALGGMIAPALIFLAIAARADPAFERGWAIPMATDIAFAIGALSLLGSRVAPGLRLFLLTLAIVDDLGAILVIAVFYTSALNMLALGGALAIWLGMLAMNHFGLRAPWLYWIGAIALWACMLQSGVHATIAGVLAAFAMPMSRLVAVEHALKPWVQLAIMPIFALTNAGVSLAGLDASIFTHPITQGAGLGLLLGKPLGIVAATLIVAALLGKRPPFSLRALLGVSLVAGIGFTMSLFIGGLAFGDGALAVPVRVGVIGGSLVAALLGLAILSIGRVGPSDSSLAADEDIAEHEGLLEER